MFHHFHNDKHLPAQGSLSANEFIKMIDWLNKHYSILNATQYTKKFEDGNIKNTDICLSFDDGLKCQFDIAVPVMEKLGIEAFFFVYSSAFSKNPDPLEIYRYFRTSCYSDIDDFYHHFFCSVKQINPEKFSREHSKYSQMSYLAEFPFYTENDKWFRYLRDHYLVGNQYTEIMNDLMIKKDFDLISAKKILWMSEQDLIDTESKGHIIGLHSYSHPTKMSKLSKTDQKLEYQKNNAHLSKLIGKPIKTMSHPCGDYNDITLKILKGIGINIGFRSNMSVKKINSRLEIPREDHANVFKEMHA